MSPGHAILPAAALLTATVLAACGGSRARMLEGEIAQAVQTSGRIELARLYPARWDVLCVFVPGTTRAQARALLGFDYAAAPYLVSRDDVAGLVFARGKQVLTAVRYPRSDGDFAAPGRSYCLPRSGAVFLVRASTHAVGGREVVPADAASSALP
ncbi:MAG TPA: hypothetical protein VF832_13265 [Longimicrobiales bacterium]